MLTSGEREYPGPFIVETADGVFRFTEIRYAATRFNAPSSPWARLLWEEYPDWGPRRLLDHRDSKDSAQRNQSGDE